jgi:GDP-fucose transporter C1
MFYNNMNACFLFFPLMLYFEADVLKAAIDSQLVSGIFWSAMTVAGFFGFSIDIITVLQIKVTSPLLHSISGAAKAAV